MMDYDAGTKSLQEIDSWASGTRGRLLTEISTAQKYMQPGFKTHKWAQRLRFLVEAQEKGKDGDYDYELVADDIDSPERYIAVSYCWRSSGEKKGEERKIRIRVNTPGGTVTRNARARPEVLMRSFKFAKAYGLRKVWIDQECINQDDRFDKESGIQSMDLVYRRAGVTLVLLSSRIENMLEAKIVEEWIMTTEGSEWMDWDSPRSMLQKKVVSDRWFTRAWTTQEFLVSAEYALKFIVGWNEDGDPELGGFMKSLQNRTCELDEKGILPWNQDVQRVEGEWVLLLQQIQGMILVATSNPVGFEGEDAVLPELRAAASLMEELHDRRDARVDNFTLSEVDISEVELELSTDNTRTPLSDIPEETSLQTPPPNNNCTPTIHPSPDSPNFDAFMVTALSTLRHKSNSRTADKLAILGNLIGYHWRIDTMAAEEKKLGFSACVFALALYNGDTSPLFGYAASDYKASRDVKYPLNTSIPSWLPPEKLRLQELQESNSHLTRTKPKGGRKCLVLKGSLLIEGLLWTISPFPDLIFLTEKMEVLLGNINNAPEGPETQHDAYRPCLQLVVRELFYLSRKDLVEIIIIHCLRSRFSTPAEIFTKLVELEEWVRGTREWPEHHALDGWDAYDAERMLWLYQTIADGKPLAFGSCNIGEDVLTAIFDADPEDVGTVFTVLSELEYEFSSKALMDVRYILANPRRQISWCVEACELLVNDDEISEATEALLDNPGGGSEAWDDLGKRELFISRQRLRITGHTEGTWSLRLSSKGIAVPVPECNCWRMVTLGKEAAYYFIQ